MNGWHRAAEFIENYAALSESRVDTAHVDGARMVAVRVWLKSAPDPEALKSFHEQRLARVLRFFAEALRTHGDRAEELSNAVTPVEPTRVSFVEEDE